jgi:hypothetical protein
LRRLGDVTLAQSVAGAPYNYSLQIQVTDGIFTISEYLTIEAQIVTTTTAAAVTTTTSAVSVLTHVPARQRNS